MKSKFVINFQVACMNDQLCISVELRSLLKKTSIYRITRVVLLVSLPQKRVCSESIEFPYNDGQKFNSLYVVIALKILFRILILAFPTWAEI